MITTRARAVTDTRPVDASRGLRAVKIPVRGDFDKSIVNDRPGPPQSGTVTLRVDTGALAELGRAGVDLAVAGIHLYKQQLGENVIRVDALNPDDTPIAPELGALRFEVQKRDAYRSRPDPPRTAPWSGRLGEDLGAAEHADFAVVWDRPAAAGGPVDLLRLSSSSDLGAHLRFDLRELLEASCEALSEPMPKIVNDALPLDELQSTITRARADGIIDPQEASAIVAAGEAGGVNPAKVALVQDAYERTPIVSWSAPGDRALPPAASPVMAHHGSTLVRAFLMRHHSLGGTTSEAEKQMLRAHPLPRPPADGEHALVFVGRASPDYNLPQRESLMFASSKEQVWVSGHTGRLQIAEPGGTLELTAPEGQSLRAGETYDSGFSRVAGGRGGGGYLMEEAGRFKIHELDIDAEGIVRKAVISWATLSQGAFGVELGVSPGHLVFERPPVEREVLEDETYQALMDAVANGGRFEPEKTIGVLAKKGYVDDHDRAMITVLRREVGGELSDKVDVGLLGFLKSQGIQPLTASGVHPRQEIETHLRVLGYGGRPPEQHTASHDTLVASVRSFTAAVAAGYPLTLADRQVLTRLSMSPHVAPVLPQLQDALARLGIEVLDGAERTPLATACIGGDAKAVGELVHGGVDVNTQVGGKPLTVTLLERCVALDNPLSQHDHRALAALVRHPSLHIELTPDVDAALARIATHPAVSTYAEAIRRAALDQPAPSQGTVVWKGDDGDAVSFDGTSLYRQGLRLPTPPNVDLQKTQIAVYRSTIAFVPVDPRYPEGTVRERSGALAGQGLVTYSPTVDQWGHDVSWKHNAGQRPMTVDERSGTLSFGTYGVSFPYPGDTLKF